MPEYRWVLPLVLLVSSLSAMVGMRVPAASAQEASFDCLKAATPVEMLICSDPELLSLDAALDEALTAQHRKLPEPQRATLLAQQREWLEQRLTRCGVPAKGGDTVSPELRWQAAPCLNEAYRSRLAALGAPPDAQMPSIAAAGEPGFVHPVCLWPIIEEDAEAMPRVAQRILVNACMKGNRHIPVTLTEDGGYASQSASDGIITWLAYRPIGPLPDGRTATIIWYNSGGSGVFSEIYLLRRTPTPDGRDALLSGDLVGGGGDRCNGGIEQAKLVDARTLQVDYRVTPQDLLAEGDEELANDNIETLAFCAVCCTGTVRRNLDLSSRQETTMSATVSALQSADSSSSGGVSEPAQACFDGVIRKAAGGSLPHTFNAAELKSLSVAFAKQCLKR